VVRIKDNHKILQQMSADADNGNVDRWRIETLEKRFEKVETVLGEVRDALRAVTAAKTCPAPGLCLELKKSIEELEAAVVKHENILSFSKGYLAAAASFGGVIGGVVSLVGGKFL
jgi:hypothetical protein